MLFQRIALVIFVFFLVTFLFQKASGSLRLTKLNMIGALYYYILAFNLAGASLIYIGLRDHYLIAKIRLPQTIDYTYYALAYTLIMFPLILILMKKLTSHFLRPRSIKAYVASSIAYNSNMLQLQGFVLVLMVVCTLATVYVFMHLGYIPIVSMFSGDNINALRQSGNRNFAGNQYVKNLLMTTLTPFVSYLTYVYYRTTRTFSWRCMFYYMAALSVIVVTYDFSKSPIITYLLGLYLLEIVLGNVESSKRFSKLVVAAVALILFFYIVMMDAGSSLFSIYTGPIGRILFTQIATLFLHVEAFPARHPFLNGASFNGWMSFLIPSAQGTRSGRVVMTIFNAVGVETNTAGVMNTIFIGEAYANFGTVGIIFAPIVFGMVIGLFAYMLPSLRKTPISMLLYVQMTLHFITVVEGGFVDIFYSASALFILMVTLCLHFIAGPENTEEQTLLLGSDENELFNLGE